MAKKKSEVLFGLGLLATAASLAYLRLTPDQKKKIGQVKDELLHSAGDQVDSATSTIKDVTDSLVEEAGKATDTVTEEAKTGAEKAQTSLDDVITLVEDKLEEFRNYLNSK